MSLDGLTDQAHVEVEPDPGHVTGLFGAEHVARPRISRSFMATAIPAPSSLFCAMVASRSYAVSVNGCSGGYRK